MVKQIKQIYIQHERVSVAKQGVKVYVGTNIYRAAYQVPLRLLKVHQL